MKFFQIILSLAITAWIFAPASLVAQSESGVISGTVVDQITLEPLPLANVLVLSTNLGGSTDEEGRFDIRNVPAGTYQLRVSLVGYGPVILSDVVVSTAKPAEVVARLDQTDIGIDVVEVRADYFQKSPDAPVSVQQLTYEEIRRSAGGFEDVVRVVSILPGVAQADPGRNDLVVRGGAPSENLFVVDNIEIPNINHFGTQGSGGGPLSFINLDFVRETSFSTGGFGARYGDRMSSVLTIDLRDGRSDRIGGKATVSATQFGLNLEGPFDRRGAFIFSARRSYLDFIFRSAGFNFVPEYWDFLGRARYSFDQRNSLSFVVIGAINDVSFFNDDAEKRFENSRILGTAQNQYASGFSWEHLFGTGYSTVTFGRSFVSYNGVQSDSLLRPIFSNRSDEGETSLRGDGVFKLGRDGMTELSSGIQAKRIKFTSSLALPDFVSTFGDTLDVSIRDVRSVGYRGSAYLQLLRHLPFGLQVVVGGRVDYFSLIDRKFYVSPRTSLTWQISAPTSVTAAAGTYYQFPSYIWLLADTRNRGLTASRADQYILGIEHLLRTDLKVRVEGFVKKYRDYPASVNRPYLVLANTGSGFGGSEDNFASFGLDRLVSEGSGRSFGLELLVQKKLSEIPVYGIFSLTWSKTRFTPLDGVERPGAFDQRMLLNLSGGYRFNERWEASTRFRYASGRPYTAFNTDGTQNVTNLYGDRIAGFHALDVRVDRRWNFSRWSLIVYVDVQNVYNNKFTSGVRWNARERSIEQNESAIGILPSIGVSAEF